MKRHDGGASTGSTTYGNKRFVADGEHARQVILLRQFTGLGKSCRDLSVRRLRPDALVTRGQCSPEATAAFMCWHAATPHFGVLSAAYLHATRPAYPNGDNRLRNRDEGACFFNAMPLAQPLLQLGEPA
jgi:hypothetical protein